MGLWVGLWVGFWRDLWRDFWSDFGETSERLWWNIWRNMPRGTNMGTSSSVRLVHGVTAIDTANPQTLRFDVAPTEEHSAVVEFPRSLLSPVQSNFELQADELAVLILQAHLPVGGRHSAFHASCIFCLLHSSHSCVPECQ